MQLLTIIQQLVDQVKWTDFIAGLGLFLFGMLLTEEALRQLIGGKVRRTLHEKTNRTISSVATGTLATALLQSSSLVGLLVLAMVGAKVLALPNAIGVVIGANLGTTLTGWIVASIGYKLDLSIISLPLIAIGSLLLVTTKGQGKTSQLFRFLIGLGLLLFGLEFMKSSIATTNFSLDSAHYPWIFLLAGIIVTAIIQSSSAAMMIALTALNADAITIYNAAAFVIGADLGTTSTVLLGSLKGSADKQRVGMAHLLFNLLTNSVAFFLLLPLLPIVLRNIPNVDPLYALVGFHTVFNLVGILLFLPFLGLFAKFLQRRFVREPDRLAVRLSSQLIVDIDSSLTALYHETQSLAGRVQRFSRHVLAQGIELKDLEAQSEYRTIKALEGELLEFSSSLDLQKLSEGEAQRLESLKFSIRNLVHSAKSMKDCEHDVDDMRESIESNERDLYEKIIKIGESSQVLIEQIISHVKSEQLFEKLHELRLHNEQVHTTLHKEIIEQFAHRKLDWPTVSTVLNINREIHIANSDFQIALARLNLNPKQFEDMLSLPVSTQIRLPSNI